MNLGVPSVNDEVQFVPFVISYTHKCHAPPHDKCQSIPNMH